MARSLSNIKIRYSGVVKGGNLAPSGGMVGNFPTVCVNIGLGKHGFDVAPKSVFTYVLRRKGNLTLGSSKRFLIERPRFGDF